MYTKKSQQTTLSFFGIDLEDLSGIYLKSTTNIYVVFKGILKGLLLDSLAFVATLYPGWGCTFVVIFFLPEHGKCSDWGWAELLYSYKILTQQSSPNTNPDTFSIGEKIGVGKKISTIAMLGPLLAMPSGQGLNMTLLAILKVNRAN